jgi:hypothetical protein
MTISDLRNSNLILLECVSGSHAQGLATSQSDTDIKGIFILPQRSLYTLDYVPQVSDKSNDVVFYELGRFMQLLAVNNPNMLELLNTPTELVHFRSPLFPDIDKQHILSKQCKDTFGKFALSQIKKAKGLKKKIVNPMPKERKTPLDFCYVTHENGSIALSLFLAQNGWQQDKCGLVNIAHMKDIYGLYYNEESRYSGIIKNTQSNDVVLSSIPKGEKQVTLLYFNRDGYSTYCKDYRAYWDWVEKRNEVRYENTLSHSKHYDAKNMMHTFRLLEMAIEIATEKQVNVYRSRDRDFLMRVKNGEFEYEELLHLAKEKQVELERAFAQSDLREMPNTEYIKQLTVEIRTNCYRTLGA